VPAVPRAGFIFVLVALAVALGDWVAVALGRRRAQYVLKPAVMVALIGAAIVLRGGDPAARWAFTLAALAFSLAGDVILILPRDLFAAGLGAFLLAHLAYVAAFNPTVPPLLPTLPAGIAVGAVGVALFVRISRAMVLAGRRSLVLPVGAYVVAITAMAVSALATAGRAEWPPKSSTTAIAGALLFYTSDALIGWSRFVGDFRGSRVLIMAAYHLGQVGLVIGLLG
jgi:uncharacterized membrane protein YhhN